MTPTRHDILRLLGEMSQRYPDWRFGQLVVNVANWASNPVLPESTWDVEDEAFLTALREHLERRFGAPGGTADDVNGARATGAGGISPSAP